uniref:Uncharacterized protein n=1 Tax=Tanacetum cinerariifolium TaxID=118510 RepID=A0A6L2LB54_TANCI|nr:hypothetical protein [Tanacetum cinerariifolium]
MILTQLVATFSFGIFADALDEYLQMGQATGLLSLEHFFTFVMKNFGLEFFAKLTISDIEKLYACHKEKHRLPGMLRSLDFTDWEWKRHCVLVLAFWFLRFVSCDLVMRFGPAFCLKTICVLPKDKLRFALKLVAFCFKTRCVLLQDTLRFASRRAAFCFKTSCVLSHGGTAFCLLLKTLSAFWFTSHVITTIADRIRDNGTSQSKQILCFRQELLEYMGVHDNDASESLKPSWGKMCTSGT